MSRDVMRGLKAKTEEKYRFEQVKNIVTAIYYHVVEAAKKNSETSYIYPLPKGYSKDMRYEIDPFFIKNMPDILAGLHELFPGCDVNHINLYKGTDGKVYDVSKLDDNVLPFVNRTLDQSYIVIDWT